MQKRDNALGENEGPYANSRNWGKTDKELHTSSRNQDETGKELHASNRNWDETGELGDKLYANSEPRWNWQGNV